MEKADVILLYASGRGLKGLGSSKWRNTITLLDLCNNWNNINMGDIPTKTKVCMGWIHLVAMWVTLTIPNYMLLTSLIVLIIKEVSVRTWM